jgi:glycosyltransferase involved in cell wall biosynthesis
MVREHHIHHPDAPVVPPEGPRVKIALLAHLHHPVAEPFAGGMESHTAMVADELVRRGHDVTLFAKADSRTRARLVPIMSAGFDYSRTRIEDGVDACDQALDDAISRALTVIADRDFDIVFNNSLNPLPYTELHDRPMITVLHTPPTLEKVNAVIESPGWAPGRRHVFVGVSETNAAAWRTTLPRVRCVPNGINLQRWQRHTRPVKDLAVWSARITPEKGLHLAIDAARITRMRLEFSGPIADPDYYAAQIVPRLGPDISHRGHLDHTRLAAHLARGQVFLSTSLWAEPFGLALVEAMACGTPVAAFPSGAARDVVGTLGGAVATDASANSLAQAVRRARTMDRNLVRGHAHRFDANTMIDAYEDIMRGLLAPGILDRRYISPMARTT